MTGDRTLAAKAKASSVLMLRTERNATFMGIVENCTHLSSDSALKLTN